MKRFSAVVVFAALAGCATAGERTQFDKMAVGPLEAGFACVTDEVEDNGWNVVAADDAGLVRAEQGTNWMQATIIPGPGGLTAASHQIRIEVANNDAARDVASKILTACA